MSAPTTTSSRPTKRTVQGQIMRTMSGTNSDLDMTHNDNLRMNPYTVDYESLKKYDDDEYPNCLDPRRVD